MYRLSTCFCTRQHIDQQWSINLRCHPICRWLLAVTRLTCSLINAPREWFSLEPRSRRVITKEYNIIFLQGGSMVAPQLYYRAVDWCKRSDAIARPTMSFRKQRWIALHRNVSKWDEVNSGLCRCLMRAQQSLDPLNSITPWSALMLLKKDQ